MQRISGSCISGEAASVGAESSASPEQEVVQDIRKASRLEGFRVLGV